jgi:hypothetical protein
MHLSGVVCRFIGLVCRRTSETLELPGDSETLELPGDSLTQSCV